MDRGDTVHLEDYVKDIEAIQTMTPMRAGDASEICAFLFFSVLCFFCC